MHPRCITLSSADVSRKGTKKRESSCAFDHFLCVSVPRYVDARLGLACWKRWFSNIASSAAGSVRPQGGPILPDAMHVENASSVRSFSSRKNSEFLHGLELSRSHSIPSERVGRSVLRTKFQAQPSAWSQTFESGRTEDAPRCSCR